MSCLRGLAQVLSNGSPIFGLSKQFNGIANGFVLGIPNLVYFLMVILVIGIFRSAQDGLRKVGLRDRRKRGLRPSFGHQHALDQGRCLHEQRPSCRRVRRMMASRITSGSPIIGVGYELNAISAAVIGGVSMSGNGKSARHARRRAHHRGDSNGLDILGVSAFYQQIIQGMHHHGGRLPGHQKQIKNLSRRGRPRWMDGRHLRRKQEHEKGKSSRGRGCGSYGSPRRRSGACRRVLGQEGEELRLLYLASAEPSSWWDWPRRSSTPARSRA